MYWEILFEISILKSKFVIFALKISHMRNLDINFKSEKNNYYFWNYKKNYPYLLETSGELSEIYPSLFYMESGDKLVLCFRMKFWFVS